MNSSNCCFLTCKQISQEAGQVVWYSHLFQNFPQFIVIHTVKGFGIVNKAEIDVFLELSSLISLSLSLSVQFSSVQSHSHVFKPSVLQIPSNWIPCLETDYFNILFLFFSIFVMIFKMLHVLATVYNVAMKIGAHVSFEIKVFSRNMPRSGVAGSYGNSFLSFLKEVP